MKPNIRGIAAFTALLGLASMGARAADGQINFTGSLVAQTCKINGNGGGAANFTVGLPREVSTSTLSAEGKTAGTTAFSIDLTDCASEPGNVHTYFEQGPTVNPATGNLIVTGGATNVEIQLLNSDLTPISLNKPDSGQNSKAVAINNGTATLRYNARYYATGQATAGTVNSNVMYSLSYN